MKIGNTSERIVDRSRGARFYCARCGGTYARYPKTRQCQCKVYLSVDAINPTAFRWNRPSGEQSPYWKGGSPGSRNGNFLKILRHQIISEQEGKCSNCGKYVGHSLHIHHIKPWRDCTSTEEAHARLNLTGLCNFCHPRAEPGYPIGKNTVANRGTEAL